MPFLSISAVASASPTVGSIPEGLNLGSYLVRPGTVLVTPEPNPIIVSRLFGWCGLNGGYPIVAVKGRQPPNQSIRRAIRYTSHGRGNLAQIDRKVPTVVVAQGDPTVLL